MKTLTRIKAFILAMVMTVGTFGTTAFAAETRDDNTVVKGEVVNSKILSDGKVATTVEYQLADSSEDAILEFYDVMPSTRMYKSESFTFTSGNYQGNSHRFEDGNYLGFELSVSSTNGYTVDQTITATLYRENLIGSTALGSAIGHTINTGSNQKADWISITQTNDYHWLYKGNVSNSHPVKVVITYYTWN